MVRPYSLLKYNKTNNNNLCRQRQLTEHCETEIFGKWCRFSCTKDTEFSFWNGGIKTVTIVYIVYTIKVLHFRLTDIFFRLASYDDVRTSYPRPPKADIHGENVDDEWIQSYEKRLGFLHRIRWHRIILDGKFFELR